MSRVTTTTSRAPRTRRRSADATRALMLRAGTELAINALHQADEDAAARALAHIRLTDVARKATEIETAQDGSRVAPITTGALYQLWPSQAAYQADLMVHVLSEAPLPVPDRLRTRAMELIAAGAAAEDIMAELADVAFSRARSTPEYDLALLFVPYSSLPRVGETLRDTYREQDVAARPIYEAILTAGRLRVRAPWRLDDLMAAMSALHDGFRVRLHSDPTIVRKRKGRSLLAEASVGLLRVFTEPDG